MHLAQQAKRVACLRDVLSSNLGQHIEHSELCSCDDFKVPAAKFGLITLDGRNQLHSIIPLPNIEYTHNLFTHQKFTLEYSQRR